MIFDSTDYCIERITLEKNVVESVVEYLKDHGYDAYLEDGYNVTENTNDCRDYSIFSSVYNRRNNESDYRGS